MSGLGFMSDVLPQFIWAADSHGMYVSANRAFCLYTGLEEAELLNEGWRRVVHPSDRKRVRSHWESAIAERTPYDIEYRLRRADGAYLWFRATAVRNASDHINEGMWIGSAVDVDHYKRTEEFLRFQADAGAAMSASLDTDTSLAQLARLAVPNLADWCILYRCKGEGSLTVTAVEHDVAALHATALDLLRILPNLGEEWLRVAIATQRPIVMPLLTHRSLCPRNTDPRPIELLRKLDPRSGLVMPIIANRKVAGILVLFQSHSGRRFQDSDTRFAELLSKRASIAVENAQRYERERRVATRLQQASLPDSLPIVDGLEFDCVYQAGRDDAQIGGDWYDAFRLSDGRIVVSIGDVSGSGLEAAVIMGSMRQVLRGVGQVTPDPIVMLDAADKSLRAERPGGFVTAFVGVFDPIAMTFSYASAGHPPPLLRAANGTIQALEGGGLPLGIRTRHVDPVVTIALEPDSLFVLYTDGLTEATRDPIEGEARLLAALANDKISGRRDAARALGEAVLGPRHAHDDIAILTIRVRGHTTELRRTWTFDVANGAMASEIRELICAELAKMGANEEECLMSELIFSEVIGNVARYAPGETKLVLDMTDANPVLHVFDRGAGFRFLPRLPRDIMSESGRGLFLIAAIAEDFSVMRRHDGGSHARIVYAIARPRKRKAA